MFTFTSTQQLATMLRSAEQAHKQAETTGTPVHEWPEWYAAHIAHQIQVVSQSKTQHEFRYMGYVPGDTAPSEFLWQQPVTGECCNKELGTHVRNPSPDGLKCLTCGCPLPFIA